MGRKKLSSSVVVPINDPPTAFNPMSLAQPTSGPHASTEAGGTVVIISFMGKGNRFLQIAQCQLVPMLVLPTST
jgi:hypothetical protein